MLHRYPILKKDINMDFTVTCDITAILNMLHDYYVHIIDHGADLVDMLMKSHSE